jgi:hypothetical protein
MALNRAEQAEQQIEHSWGEAGERDIPRLSLGSLRKVGGLVDAPGSGLGGAKRNSPFRNPYPLHLKDTVERCDPVCHPLHRMRLEEAFSGCREDFKFGP